MHLYKLIIAKDSPSPSKATVPFLPLQYTDYTNVFNVLRALELPLVGTYVHAINLKENTSLPFKLIYPLAEKELEVLQNYLKDAVAQG